MSNMLHYNNPMGDTGDSSDNGQEEDFDPPVDEGGEAPAFVRRASFEDTGDEMFVSGDAGAQEKVVEQELERLDALRERQEAVAFDGEKHQITAADRQHSQVVGYFVVPVLTILLLVLLIGIFMNGSDIQMSAASIFGVVVVSTISYLGCVFIIYSHFANPHMWSERRQQMMFCAWAGLVHYLCLLYEVYHQADHGNAECGSKLPVLTHAAFLAQMMWQISVVHGVFRYIHYRLPTMSADQKTFRHMCCWGLPIVMSSFLWAIDAMYGMSKTNKKELLDRATDTGRVLSPWCGVSADPDVRGLKALFVHLPEIIGVVMYCFFYFYIALDGLGSSGIKRTKTSDLGQTRISASPHQILMETSSAKQQVDVTRAATTVRHCMAAFLMAYLLQTIVSVLTEQFDKKGTSSAQTAYLARIYLVTPQQLLYAFVFSNTRFGLCKRGGGSTDKVGTAPTATIKSADDGHEIAMVSTEANSILVDKLAKDGADDNMHILVKPKRNNKVRKFFRKLLQAVMFMPASVFAWLPISIIRENFTKNLGSQLLLAITYVMVMLFPFVYFQGTRETQEDLDTAATAVDCYLLLVIFGAIFGVWRIRNEPSLLVVDEPHDFVRWKHMRGGADTAILALRAFVTYTVLVIEFLQIPMLSYSAAQLSTRYGTRSQPREFDLDLDYLADMTVRWTFDDLFLVQYPMAVLGIVLWMMIHAVSQSYEMVYLRSIDTLVPRAITQLCLYGLSGPGFIFITKNLMKPLFCIPTVVEGTDKIMANRVYLYGIDSLGVPESFHNTTGVQYGDDGIAESVNASGVRSIVSANKRVECWSEDHLMYCTISLCCLCLYIPTACLTKAQFYLPEEDIRNVYYFQRIELALKGLMIYIALSFQNHRLIALTFLVISSLVLCGLIMLMKPSNMKFINRIKIMIHIASIYFNFTCFWAILADNKDRWLHAGILFAGWLVIWIVHRILERTKWGPVKDGTDSPYGVDFVPCMNDVEVSDDVLKAAAADILDLQQKVTSPFAVMGKRISWGTHADILRLLQYARHKNLAIRKKAFESMAVLSYQDQLAIKSSFAVYTASTSMEIFGNAIVQPDDALRMSAIRTVKTFLQRDQHLPQMIELLEGGAERFDGSTIEALELAAITASMIENGTRLPAQIDAGICLLEICTVDSNQLSHVVRLLPTLNEWLVTGSLVAQHLALELIARCSSRFDLDESIVASNCLPAIFELFNAIDAATTPDSAQAENTSSGFRKGFAQPDNISTLAHQLPKNVANHFAAQFKNSATLLKVMQRTTSEVDVDADDSADDSADGSIRHSDFVAWANSGNALSEQLKAAVIAEKVDGLAAGTDAGGSGEVTDERLWQLFDLMVPSGKANDEGVIADFLDQLGLGDDRATILQSLIDTGLRPRAIEEMFATDDSVIPERFAQWLRLSETNPSSLAQKTVEAAFKDQDDSQGLSDEMCDALFSFIDASDGDSCGSIELDAIAKYLERENVEHPGGNLYKVLKTEMVARSATDTLVKLSPNHIETMKNEMIQFVLHIVMECGGGMSALGRKKMIEDGVLDIILWSLRGTAPVQVRLVALQGLQALVADNFSLDDVLSDSELKGYYADCVQLTDEATIHQEEHPVLVFENLTAVQRRKVHMVAQFASLAHLSSGPPEERIVTVSPLQTAGESGTESTLLKRFSSSVSRDSRDEQQIEEPPPPAETKGGKDKGKKSGFSFKRKKKVETEVAPKKIVVERGVDPWDPELYNENREGLVKLGVVEILCDLVADEDQDGNVVFQALEIVLELNTRGCVSESGQARILKICCQTVQHQNIGVAVLASFNIATIMESPAKADLFAPRSGSWPALVTPMPAEPIKRFRRAGRMVINQLGFIAGVSHSELDAALQRARASLR